jgi:hypothetical protein
VLRPGEGTAGPSPECYGRAVKLELMVEMGIRARLRQGAHQERPTKAPLTISLALVMCRHGEMHGARTPEAPCLGAACK